MIVSEYVCFECGAEDDLHNHHVVPKILGGTRTIPLCEKCHGLVHGRHMVNHTRLVVKGLEKARKKGVHLGRKPGSGETPEQFLQKHSPIVTLLIEGASVRVVARDTGHSTSTVQRVKRVIRDMEV